MMPAPMPPALTPNAARPLEISLPQLLPTHGVTNPSARAWIGAPTRPTAAARTTTLSARRIACFSFPMPPDSQAATPEGRIASDVPHLVGRAEARPYSRLG